MQGGVSAGTLPGQPGRGQGWGGGVVGCILVTGSGPGGPGCHVSRKTQDRVPTCILNLRLSLSWLVFKNSILGWDLFIYIPGSYLFALVVREEHCDLTSWDTHLSPQRLSGQHVKEQG